ncbi:hypothetical protein H9P43_001227 [Blastocladiella emersonii ATCC 22665]|nr:hypothetical protein H9P43_001227 [Blastocladiella emersonii ATCC 22665]
MNQTPPLSSFPPLLPRSTVAVPLSQILLASPRPWHTLAKVLARHRGLQAQLAAVAVFAAVGLAVLVQCHRLQRNTTDLDKRRYQIMWAARSLYTLFAAAWLVYSFVRPGWLGTMLLMRAFFFCLGRVVVTVHPDLGDDEDRSAVRARNQALANGGRNGRGRAIVIVARRGNMERTPLFTRLRRTASGSLLASNPPETFLVMRTGRVASSENLAAPVPPVAAAGVQ